MFRNVHRKDSATFTVRIWLWYEDEGDYDCQVYGELQIMSNLTMKCQMQGTFLGLGLEVW